jgi:putative endonuclease
MPGKCLKRDRMQMDSENWKVYLLRCADNSLYCGISKDIESRLIEHNSGKGAKYTRSRRPVELVAVSAGMTKSRALKLEHRIKRLPAGRKLSKLNLLA